MTSLRKSSGVILCGLLISAGPAIADVVADWNLITSETAFAVPPPRPPGASAILDFATVHAAMHDAIQAFDKRFEPYAGANLSATGSPVAAAAAAAHGVLVNRFPLQATALNTLLQNYLSVRNLTGNPGVAIGEQAATRILNLRANDGSWPSNPEIFNGGTEPGEWRPTLPAFAPMQTPWLATVTPFTLRDPTQLRASPPPPHLRSGDYARDYNEVQALGSADSTARSQAQTDLAVFYSDNFIALWERTLRGISSANQNNIGDSGRLFALANMAAADAIISAWDTKRHWNFWRPITAIREGNNDGNSKTAGDPVWLPFVPTPPYADYTSGANALTGAMTGTLEQIFGDKTTFFVMSTTANKTQTYHRFSDMANDVVDVRVYQGIHFRSADEVGRRQGAHAAQWAFSHFLRPLR